jgi:hypothetical protein
VTDDPVYIDRRYREGSTLNNEITGLDQADEEILTYTLSDEALEAAAGAEAGIPTLWTFCPGQDCSDGNRRGPTSGAFS